MRALALLSDFGLADHYAGVLHAVLERGHTVASHGFAHEDLSLKSRKEVAHDIERSLRTIEAVSGV